MTQPLKFDHRDLFERYYPVRFKHFESRSSESIRKHGVRVSGIPEVDSSIESYEVESELTIDAMFEMWRRGVTIKVCNYGDTAEIYEIIQRHVVKTSEFLQGTVNGTRMELLRDMVDLDRFAAVVYNKAKSIFTEQERAAVNTNSFAGMQSINFFNILNKDYARIDEVKVVKSGEIQTKKTKATNRQAPVRERDDLSSIFIDQIERIGGIGGIHVEKK